MRPIPIALLSLLFSSPISPLFAWQDDASPQSWPEKVGAGIDTGVEGSRLRMFVDLGKVWRPAQRIEDGKPAATDETGWPTEDFFTVLFDVRPVPAWAPPIDDPDSFQPDFSGVYKSSFTGRADVATNQPEAVVPENLVYDEETNRTTFDLRVDSGQGLVILFFRNTRRSPDSESNTGITALRVIRPGYEEKPDQTFTDEFLASLRPFRVIRFMGFLMTNNTNPEFTEEKNVWEWEDRRLPSDATQQRTPRKAAGVAWEYAIEICNAVDKDMWLDIPIAATDGYIRGLAKLLRETLEPERRIYVEISNEVWNPGFRQYKYNRDAAAAEVAAGNSPLNKDGTTDPNVWARRRVLKRLIEAMKIFAEEFGEDQLHTRLEGVYAWWTIYPQQYWSTLAWSKEFFEEPKRWIDAVAKTSYYNAHAAPSTLSPEEIVEYMKTDSDKGVTYTRRLKGYAEEFGLKLYAYEAGPDNGGGATANVANRIRANRLEAMGSLMRHDFEKNWIAEGGDLYVFLEVASAYSRYGCWGQTEDVRDLQTPKCRAVRALAGVSEPPPPQPEEQEEEP